MSRYIGRANGKHRGKTSWTFKPTPLFWLTTAAATMVLAAVIVWIINPGSSTPGEEKGSRPTAGVTPTGNETSPSGHTRHR